MNLPDAKTWFRFRCKITNNIKGNTSSIYKDNCTKEEVETQDHLEKCQYTKAMRKNLDLENEREHMILQRKINRTLKELYKKLN